MRGLRAFEWSKRGVWWRREERDVGEEESDDGTCEGKHRQFGTRRC